MLILPPPNHSACGGSHFSTVSHVLNQCNSSSARRAQNASGSADASARRRSSSAIDLMCARSEKDSDGGKIRCSCSTDSMFVVTLDMRACVPYFIATKKRKSGFYDYDSLRRHQRLQLQGMEGKFLSRKDSGERHARVLRVAAARGRAEQHVLSHAAAGHDRELEGAGAEELSFLSKSTAVDYALQTTQ